MSEVLIDFNRILHRKDKLWQYCMMLHKKVWQTKTEMAANIYSVTRTLFYDQQKQQFHNAQGPRAINRALAS